MLSIVSGKRPDITPAQLVGLIPVLATLLNVFGVYHLSPEQTDALEKAVYAGFVLFGADAVVRTGRNHADAKVQAAGVTAAAVQASTGAPGAAGPLLPEPGAETPASQTIAQAMGDDDDGPSDDVKAVYATDTPVIARPPSAQTPDGDAS